MAVLFLYRLSGTLGLFTVRQKNAAIGELLAEVREFTGKISMRILALKELFLETHRARVNLRLKSGWIRGTLPNQKPKR